MRRFSRRASYWPIALLILAVGVFSRGRTTHHTQRPEATSRPASTGTPRPKKNAATTPEPAGQHAPRTDAKPATAPLVAQNQDHGQLRLHVVGVHDGDTITGLDDTKTQHKIRLDAIDAPELGQPYGQASKKALAEKVFGKEVDVIVKTHDKYGRTVGHVLINGRDANLEMLEEGMAWHYEQYDHNKRLREAEQSARDAGKGLWQDRAPVPPWEYRKEHRHNGQHPQLK